jgi:hypothetical protein
MESAPVRRGYGILILLSTILVATAGARQQVAPDPEFTTICSIWKDPAAFAGKVVKLRAELQTGFENSSIVEPDGACGNGMWFSFAREKDDDSKYLDDRDAVLQAKQPVFLSKDDGFKAFEKAIDAQVYPRKENSACMNCPLYTVTASMVGRVDYAGEKGWGFGHLNGARLRFVMFSVSEVSTRENSYDWNEWSPTPIRFPHGTVQGKIMGPDGQGVRFGEVEAVPVEGKIPIINPEAMTEEDGTYSLDLKPGRYLIVVNRDSPATKNVPMSATYYPRAEGRKQAQIVSIADGVTLPNIDIQPLRALEEKHLRVRVIWPDGTPVEEANVDVGETGNPYAIAGDDEGGVRHTDKDGWATLLAYAGKSYRLSADIYKKPGYVPYCEDVFALPSDFRDGLEVVMVLRRQSETCRGQWDEAAKPVPATAIKN